MSTTNAAPGDITHLVEQVTALGGTIPADLHTVIDAITAVNDWTPPTPTDIASLCRRGDLTADNAADILTDALIQPNRQPGDLKVIAKHELTQRFTRVLAGLAGDEIIESIRPAFTDACGKIAAAADLVNPTDRVDILESADNDTITAWRTLGEQKGTLDRIDSVIDILTTKFEVLGGRKPWHVGNALRAAMYAPGHDYLAMVSKALSAPNGVGGARAGKWHGIAGAVRLNTISTARQMLADAEQAHNDQVAADRATLTTNAADRPGRPRSSTAA